MPSISAAPGPWLVWLLNMVYRAVTVPLIKCLSGPGVGVVVARAPVLTRAGVADWGGRCRLGRALPTGEGVANWGGCCPLPAREGVADWGRRCRLGQVLQQERRGMKGGSPVLPPHQGGFSQGFLLKSDVKDPHSSSHL